MTRMPDRDDDAAEVLQKMLAAAPAMGFTDREVATLRQLIDAFRGWQMLGRATKWLIAVLVTLAGAAVAWDTLASHVRGWWQP